MFESRWASAGASGRLSSANIAESPRLRRAYSSRTQFDLAGRDSRPIRGHATAYGIVAPPYPASRAQQSRGTGDRASAPAANPLGGSP